MSGCHTEAEAEPAVVAAIRADLKFTAEQRRALLEVYTAFVGPIVRLADGRGAGAPRPEPREGPQETSSRAALVYALATSRVKSACAAAVLAIQSTLVVPAAFS
jgi:hypothetical protein